jgi:glutamyl-tRNA reductase
MGVTVVGVSHRTAPVAVRERIAYRGAECAGAVTQLLSRTEAAEGVLVSTCNRTEFYLAAGSPLPMAAVEAVLSDRLGEDAAAYVYSRGDRDAVAHLFAVASGIDSQVFGEAQIQGQVRDALEHCRTVAGPVLTRLFQSAAHCASRVRNETVVARGAGSISSAAVQLARKIFGSLAGRRAMVLGAGDIAELALECLTAEGVRVGIVANRTHARAQALAVRYKARAMHYDDCWDELRVVDVLLCSTAAPRPIVHREHVLPALRRRGGPLCILDIALPRDVSPDVRTLDNVFLYDLDDLYSAANAAVEQRREDLDAARAIIAAETERYWEWLAGLQAVPVLTRMREELDRLRRAELAAAARKFGPLTDRQSATLDEFSRALMNKFLHSPSVRLREAAGNGRGLGIVDAAQYLFGLEEGRTAPPADPAETT